MNQLPQEFHTRASNPPLMRLVRTLLGFALSVVALLKCPEIASAGLIADVSYQRELRFDPDVNSQQFQTGPSFAGTGLPVDQTLSILGNGVSVAAHYTFTDNGSVAEFKIDCTSSFASSNAGFVEVSDPGNDLFPITFTTTQPLMFTITVDAIGNAVVNAGIYGPGGAGVDTRFVSTASGLLEGNTLYNIIELQGDYEGLGGSGTSSFDLVLTPVPEPAGTFLFALGASALLLRRSWKYWSSIRR
jgi:hypothetical protein